MHRTRTTLLLIASALGACASPNGAAAGWDELPPETVAELRDELLERMQEDQAIRSRMGPGMTDEEREHAQNVDAENTARLEELVDMYGWPPSSVVGDEASLAAFLLVQHADQRPDFQARCLPMLEDAASRGEISPGHLAYLTDRVRVAQGEPQVYGTQYGTAKHADGTVIVDEDGNAAYVLQPVEDPANLDARRASMGLGPWLDYERSIAGLQNREACATPEEAMGGARR